MRLKALSVIGIAVLAGLLSNSGPALGQPMDFYHSGNYWLQRCTGGVADQSACLSYVSGLDAMHAWHVQPRLYCAPHGVMQGQMVYIFTNYLRDNPARRHENVVHLAVSAFQIAFPCR